VGLSSGSSSNGRFVSGTGQTGSSRRREASQCLGGARGATGWLSDGEALGFGCGGGEKRGGSLGRLFIWERGHAGVGHHPEANLQRNQRSILGLLQIRRKLFLVLRCLYLKFSN
jgi:hypothetical protein